MPIHVYVYIYIYIGRERASENDDLVESLRQEVDTLRIEKTEAEKKGKELEKGLGVCENKRKSLQLQVDKNDRLQKEVKEKAKEKEKEKAKEKEQEKEVRKYLNCRVYV